MARIPVTQRLARIWLNLSLPAKGGAIVAIPVICTFCMLILLADLQRKFESANQWVVHTEQVRSQAREILASSLSTEATARGYLLTREPAFLELHRNARKRVSDGFTRILRLTEDNPGQQAHFRNAMRLMQDETAALEAQIAMPAGSDLSRAVNASRRRLDTLQAEIEEFEAEESRLLALGRQQSLNHRDSLRLALWGFCVAGVFSGVLGSALFASGFKRRLDRIAANAASFARRESSGPVDGSSDAIGQLEETLIATARTLLDRESLLSENAAELERAKLAAESAARARTEFVATVSHEIRSPMNAVLGAADLLAATGLTEKQAEYVRLLNRAGNNVLSVVNEVLDHAKIEAGCLELESVPFDCAAVVERVVEMLSPGAANKGLELFSRYMLGAPRRLLGDPNRLQRVLINLVSNAIKFTESGGVAVNVQPAEAAGQLHFSVADTGIGIPRDRQEAIFRKFTQAGAATAREYGGTGLGLAIAKHIIELMGGRIWVESEAGAGSTFHFTVALPTAEAGVAPPLTAPAAAVSSGITRRPLNARILLAEDSATNVALIKAYLAGVGCALETAADGEAALAALTHGRYNLVLMDVQMPKLDGYEVTRRFREWERAAGRPRTPVIAVTAHAFQEDVEQAIKAGADAHLTKPFRRDTLFDAIELFQRPDGGCDIRVELPDSIRELAPEFLRRQRFGLLTVAAALKGGEFDPIQTFAHNMKGCGRSFGFPRLTDLGREIECAARDRDPVTLRRHIQELKVYLTEVDIA